MVAVKVHAEFFAAALSKRAIMEAWAASARGIALGCPRCGVDLGEAAATRSLVDAATAVLFPIPAALSGGAGARRKAGEERACWPEDWALEDRAGG